MSVKSYYNFGPLLSYNATFNFCAGARGLGKTWGRKYAAIRDAIKHGHEFIYLRRYKPSVAASAPTFFADIAHKFPDYEFRVNGRYAQMRKTFKPDPNANEKENAKSEKSREWQTIGYFIALSVAQSQKGVSYAKVKTIIFDEFIEEGTLPYLPNEWVVFNNFYITVDRWQGRTKVFFLANAVSIDNPYFIRLEIRPDTDENNNGFIVKRNGFVVAHFPDSADFKAEVYETAFGQFLKDDPDFAATAIENIFHDNHDALTGQKPATARPQFTLETVRHGTFSLWHDMGTSKFYATKKSLKVGRTFTLDPNKMDDTGKQLVTYRDPVISKLRSAWRNGRVIFDEPATRNAFIDILDR